MNTTVVRVIDVLTEAEREKIAECETNIIMARTPVGVRLNRRRANKIMAEATTRYKSSIKAAHSHS